MSVKPRETTDVDRGGLRKAKGDLFMAMAEEGMYEGVVHQLVVVPC
jgi:hypothetical protein